LQNGDDLVFGESCLAHGDLLRGHNQYAGRSLKVNGPVYRDTYKPTKAEAHQSFCKTREQKNRNHRLRFRKNQVTTQAL
ncbi:hypothetical protein, partial [Raoultella sp. RLT01]|uniref:hypothetical protein n=1 Tax=Raoultella sp. RLT01 TaxID=2769256 RepID=UPI001CE0DC6E